MVRPAPANPAMGRTDVRHVTLSPEAGASGRNYERAPNSLPYMTGRCGFNKADGKLCTNMSYKDHEFCFGHVRFENG
jgi:hypothetical protein